MESGRAAGSGLRRRTLRGSIMGFLILTLAAGVALPPFLSDGDYLADPAFWAAIVGAPIFMLLWLAAATRPPARVAPWFVGTAMVVAWIFTVLIQGSGYLVGNYAYLTVIVLLAAFFLTARATTLYAAANLVGVIVVSTVWGLGLADLVLSIAYIVLFSGMLIIIATTFEHDAWILQRVNRDLMEVEAHQKQILDTTQDIIIVLDRDHRIVSYNARAAAIFREVLQREPHAGEPLIAALHPPMQKTFAQLLRNLAAQGDATVEAVYETPAGLRAYRARLSPLPDRSGGTVLISTDITQQHLRLAEERERILHEAEMEKLRGLHELQRDFINVASHELQTPLTPLRLQAHMLSQRAGPGLAPGDRKALDVIERNIDRMARLVDDILEVVRIGSGRLPVDKHRIDVAALARQCVDDHRPAAAERGVRLLADGPECLWVTADGSRIEQILNNLIRNALRFTRRGGHVRVIARPEAPGQYVLKVQDDGIGMEPEQVGRLFQPFVQLHQDVMPRTGTGLGLAICRGLAEAHGGTIKAHSDGPGKGALFTVRLPVHGVARPPRPSRRVQAPRPPNLA